MDCNRYPLGRLPDAHGVYEQLQWGEIPVLDELDWSAVLKIPVGSVEKDTRIRLVAGVEIHERNPNPIEPTQFALQACWHRGTSGRLGPCARWPPQSWRQEHSIHAHSAPRPTGHCRD